MGHSFADGQAMRGALARHDEILRAAVGEHNGNIVKTTGGEKSARYLRGQGPLVPGWVETQYLASLRDRSTASKVEWAV